jgi:hypothetical protein
MQRRTFMTAGAWLTVSSAWAAPWLDGDGLHADLALVDTTLREAAALADHAARAGWPVVDIGRMPHADIAALWYGTLAPYAARSQGRLTLVGVTRAADFFVLARLAQRPAMPAMHTRGASPRGSLAFALTL